MARKITDSISIKASLETVFRALITPSMIRQWWQASGAIVLAEKDGIYSVTWGDEDQPDYITSAVISEIDAPYKLTLNQYKYYSKDGRLPFDDDLPSTFTLASDGADTILTVQQDGFPEAEMADPYYAGCVKGWRDTLAGIKQTLEAE